MKGAKNLPNMGQIGGREKVLIGGGNSALEEGIFLSEFCKHVSIESRSTKFTASETYLEKLSERPSVLSSLR